MDFLFTGGQDLICNMMNMAPGAGRGRFAAPMGPRAKNLSEFLQKLPSFGIDLIKATLCESGIGRMY